MKKKVPQKTSYFIYLILIQLLLVLCLTVDKTKAHSTFNHYSAKKTELVCNMSRDCTLVPFYSQY